MKKSSLLLISVLVVLVMVLILVVILSKEKSPSRRNFSQGVFEDIDKIESIADINEAIKHYKALSEDKNNESKLDEILFKLGSLYEKKSKFDDAKECYKKIISTYITSPILPQVQERLGGLNIKILFSPEITPDSVSYEVASGDTLGKIAKKFGTTVDLVKKSNNITGDQIRTKMKLKICTAKFSIILDKSQNTLTLKSNEEVFKVYRVATGVNNCTPTGTFIIITKIVDPVWYTQDAVVPSGSPKNILGSRWLGISKEHYGIHGSNGSGEDMGKQVTAGCVRMRNSDVEELYTIVPINTEVIIVD